MQVIKIIYFLQRVNIVTFNVYIFEILKHFSKDFSIKDAFELSIPDDLWSSYQPTDMITLDNSEVKDWEQLINDMTQVRHQEMVENWKYITIYVVLKKLYFSGY